MPTFQWRAKKGCLKAFQIFDFFSAFCDIQKSRQNVPSWLIIDSKNSFDVFSLLKNQSNLFWIFCGDLESALLTRRSARPIFALVHHKNQRETRVDSSPYVKPCESEQRGGGFKAHIWKLGAGAKKELPKKSCINAIAKASIARRPCVIWASERLREI